MDFFFNTRSQTHQCPSPDTSTSQSDITPEVSEVTDPTSKLSDSRHVRSSPADFRKLTLSAKGYPNTIKWKRTSAWNGSFYTCQRLTLQTHHWFRSEIPCFSYTQVLENTVLVEAHDKLGQQGNTCTYCLIKCQYYWKGMNKDIQKYIAHCTLCHREKANVQAYPLQMIEIPDRPFNKIAIDLVTECKTSNLGNKHHPYNNWSPYRLVGSLPNTR